MENTHFILFYSPAGIHLIQKFARIKIEKETHLKIAKNDFVPVTAGI